MRVYCKFSVGSYLQRQLGEWIVHLGLFYLFFFFQFNSVNFSALKRSKFALNVNTYTVKNTLYI